MKICGGVHMKTAAKVFAVGMVCVSVSVLAQRYSGLGGYLTNGSFYVFEIATGEKDYWDWRAQEMPPLSPGKAAHIAEQFMAQIPPAINMKGWEVWGINLELITKDRGKPEGWVYKIHFEGIPAGQGWIGPLPTFDVIVEMDGTIPKTEIKKN
jgi:hypothetical protein